MKQTEVNLFCNVISSLFQKKLITSKNLIQGLNQPLDVLSDIVIDAPLAGTHLSNIVASLINSEFLSLDFLLQAPDYFLESGDAAFFAKRVISSLTNSNDDHLAVVDKLMTEQEKEKYGSA